MPTEGTEDTWSDWNNHLVKFETKTQQDYVRSKFLETVAVETPRIVDDRKLLSTLNTPSFALAKCAICRKVFLPAVLTRHCHESHPDVKVDLETTSSRHALPVKNEPLEVKPKKTSKRPPSQPQIRSGHTKRPRTESKDDRVLILPRSQPIIIYGEISSDEEPADADSLPLDGVTYVSRPINPIAYPRYGCYSDVVKGPSLAPFSSAARQLNQHLALIAQPNPVVPAFEAQDFKGSSPMTPLS